MHSSFRIHPDELNCRAVRMLHNLLLDQGLDAVRRAYADATTQAFRNEYIQAHPLEANRHGRGHVRGQRLKGNNWPCKRCDLAQAIPAADHLSEWTHDGKTAPIISQAYNLSYVTLKETVAFCEVHGLTVTISTEPSWVFPGAVITVEYRRAEKPVAVRRASDKLAG